MNITENSERAESRPEPRVEPFRVLLVEDNPVNLRLMRRLLEAMNCRVDVAVNGREAVSKFIPGRYEVAFMDCHMPVMDGYDATCQIRQAEQADRLPIVAVTASVVPADHDRCLQVGMSAVLTKPINPEDVAAALQRWCPRPPLPLNPSMPGTDETPAP